MPSICVTSLIKVCSFWSIVFHAHFVIYFNSFYWILLKTTRRFLKIFYMSPLIILNNWFANILLIGFALTCAWLRFAIIWVASLWVISTNSDSCSGCIYGLPLWDPELYNIYLLYGLNDLYNRDRSEVSLYAIHFMRKLSVYSHDSVAPNVLWMHLYSCWQAE